PDEVKLQRLERLTNLQRAITAERYERHIGRTAQAIVDRAATDDEPAQARVIWQGDDVDGITLLSRPVPPGSLIEVTVDDVVDDYDFAATPIRTLRAAPVRASASRSLPVMAGIVSGSFGR
ncbi:MAG: hypothetical protein M3081_01250, partial [Gemmatimonadota bacterium]|nr:hypothetical protein [Gemmatimonadota bacterium]